MNDVSSSAQARLPRRPAVIAPPVEWPAVPRPISPARLAGAAVAGLVAAVLLPGRPGLNVPIASVCALATAFMGARHTRTSMVFAALAAALLTLPALIDAGWITVLAIALAVPLASYALTGGRTWIDLLGGGSALLLAVPRAASWARRGLAGLVPAARRPTRPLAGSLLLAGVLLAVFGTLFATADAAFRTALAGLVPDIPPDTLLTRIVVFGSATATVLIAAFLTVSPPRFARPPAASPIGRVPWAIPIGALNLLFLGFVAVQADVLLSSDKTRLLRSAGLTYAEYARQGFWQLLIVTGLVLAVMAVAVRYAPLRSGADRALVRVLLGLLCALTLLVVAVALRRLYLYEEAYGWTRLRLWVHAFELWMGLVIASIAIAGISLKAAWLPRAVAVSGAAGLLALGLLNADGFIAARDVHHFRQTGTADLSYLGSLSADAVPALDRLPEPQRSCVLSRLADDLGPGDPWRSVNLSRAHARALLRAHPVQRPLHC